MSELIAKLKDDKEQAVIGLTSALGAIEQGNWPSVKGILQGVMKHVEAFQENETAYRQFYKKDFGELDLTKL